MWKTNTERVGRGERRRAGRAACRLAAEIATRTERIAVEVRDISLTGVRLHSPVATLPAFGTLHIPEQRIEVLVKRCWRRGEVSGWAFLFDGAEAARLEALAPPPAC